MQGFRFCLVIVMLYVVKLNAIMLNVIKLNVVMLNVVMRMSWRRYLTVVKTGTDC